MYKSYKTKIFGGILLIGLSACGGGSSGGNESVSGTWTGITSKLTDSCIIIFTDDSETTLNGQTVTFNHNVNEIDGTVTVTDEKGISYIGANGASGFTVNGNKIVSKGGKTCTNDEDITYAEIDSDSDNSASILLSINQKCDGNPACNVTYSGTASRITGNLDPLSPTIPLTGGCPEINQNPAAGTYSGSGECGISEVTYQLTSQGTDNLVVLNSFGANGSTSFTYNSANPNIATSNSNDLVIKGEAGYSCALTCSAPTTFTVNCFKEGGATCIEKF